MKYGVIYLSIAGLVGHPRDIHKQYINIIHIYTH